MERHVYDLFTAPTTGGWVERSENKLRIEHLKYARDRCEGIFDSIVITCKEGSVAQIVRREIGSKMRLVNLNERTGQCRAERVR